ncbi:hypothetical protein SAY86_020734 [Trapa natans]|uniref:RING-type domain-containing protein n=1 Tax=Trapa natans TaxID=22666 RepID=A0AAN7M3K8_TRANT|nr:hypothetical protein SAY86_020734 [Trapa natans]
MAVQAQYPSKVPLNRCSFCIPCLLLVVKIPVSSLLNNRLLFCCTFRRVCRNVQEGQGYPLQLCPGAIFLDQKPQGLPNNGGTINQRKRAREVLGRSADNNIFGSTHSMNVYSLPAQHQQPTQLIDLTQLHNNNNSVTTGLRLSFTDQQSRQHYHHHQQQQKKKKKVVHDSSAISQMFKEDLTTHLRQQMDEIDQFLHAQGEQLRCALAEKRQRHYLALQSAVEESLARRLKEKEAEAEKATRRNAELIARVTQLGAEARFWQAKALSQEAMAVSLRAHIQQAITSGVRDQKVDGCGGAALEGQAADDAESVYEDSDKVSSSEPSCKVCQRRAATVLMLPCRHLSACTECERVTHACPLCLCARSSSIEVFFQ